MMRDHDVLEIVSLLAAAGAPVWIDGGWGIDALLQGQTREHDDLDVVIALATAETAKSALATAGFTVAEDEMPTRFVLRDRSDRRIDFHPVTFDAAGWGWQELQDGASAAYPAEGFLGIGRIAGVTVPCLTAALQWQHHCGYEPDAKDRHDMNLLADRFGLALPDSYES